MSSIRCFLALSVVFILSTNPTVVSSAPVLPGPVGTTSAVSDLVERILPGESSHFTFSLVETSNATSPHYYTIKNLPNGTVWVSGSTANAIAFGLGEYLRNDCKMAIGWPRGGGSSFRKPASWPVATEKTVTRVLPWTYGYNVCAHSYSFVWYTWQDWEKLIDWMALWGVNNAVALTGQEELMYQVYSEYGLNDTEIRSWFNGPAFLTWSRSQNEYGAGIAGPLPRSFMKQQFELQKLILKRYRSLGIVGQLPGFIGNMPASMKKLFPNNNITVNSLGTTAYVIATDPLFGQIADKWMKLLIDSFGTDHWYSLDGWFNGEEGHWFSAAESVDTKLIEAQSEVQENHEVELTSDDVPVDPVWYARGKAVYESLNRTDPDAVWAYQSFIFHDWGGTKQGSYMRGFADAVPKGRWVINDMNIYPPSSAFLKWKGYWGQSFIWTTIQDFGGSDGLKGDLHYIADNLPSFAINHPDKSISDSIIGVGFTPEGIDQNPAYYEFLIGQAWRHDKVSNVSEWLADRTITRYNLKDGSSASAKDVADAWRLLGESVYNYTEDVYDKTAVSGRWYQTVRAAYDTCLTYSSWGKLLSAGEAGDGISSDLVPYRYDLVNLGREVLAQLTYDSGMSFHKAWGFDKNTTANATLKKKYGDEFNSILLDLDELVATDPSFSLGGWLSMVKNLADDINGTDCVGFDSCEEFYLWNAKVQLTTWNPMKKNQDGKVIPLNTYTNDYGCKHWSGLIKDYYVARYQLIANGNDPVESLSNVGYYWPRNSTLSYTDKAVGDFLKVSRKLYNKYGPYFSHCQP